MLQHSLCPSGWLKLFKITPGDFVFVVPLLRNDDLLKIMAIFYVLCIYLELSAVTSYIL